MRGLIGVLRGDDSAVYFQMLAHDFKQLELQRLKAKAQKIPPKMRVFSCAMLMCFLITYCLLYTSNSVKFIEAQEAVLTELYPPVEEETTQTEPEAQPETTETEASDPAEPTAESEVE